MKVDKWILPIIVIAQFCCTSLWFAGNAVMGDLVVNFSLEQSSLGHLTTAIQFGFISGTFIFALLMIADRFSPSKVFCCSAILGALFNILMTQGWNNFGSLILFRFLTGFCLAGIYPIGMKIAADYYEKGLGKSLGFLVGALVLGTAFPHLLNSFGTALSWEIVLLITSCLAVLGGSLMLVFVPNGPYRKTSQALDLGAIAKIFNNRNFRAAAMGYFGHMWELYTFWAFVPVLLTNYADLYPEVDFNISLLSFFIIGIGGMACVLGGYLSQLLGTQKTALIALSLSGLCCLFCPLFFLIKAPSLFVAFLLFWGMVVVADSPLFSTLVAQNAPTESKGTALTIVNCIGFSITIVSIQLLTLLSTKVSLIAIYPILVLGPMVGVGFVYYNNYKTRMDL